MIEIRTSSLEILAHLCSVRGDIHQILIDIDIVNVCCGYVESYPNELVDQSVLSLSLEILISIFENNEKIEELLPFEKLTSIMS